LRQKTALGSVELLYEFRALVAVPTSVTSGLETDFEAVREPIIQIMSELEDGINRHKLRGLLILSKRVSTFEQKAKLVRDAIEVLLEGDDHLASMCLTRRPKNYIETLEIIPSSRCYWSHTTSCVMRLCRRLGTWCREFGIRSKYEFFFCLNLCLCKCQVYVLLTCHSVRAIPDANRNALMLLDLKFSIGTPGLAMGTFMAGVYGMNLESSIEETNWGFASVMARLKPSLSWCAGTACRRLTKSTCFWTTIYCYTFGPCTRRMSSCSWFASESGLGDTRVYRARIPRRALPPRK